MTTTTGSDEIAKRVHAALEQTEVVPTHILPENSVHLRPRYNKKTHKAEISTSSLSSVTSLADQSEEVSASVTTKGKSFLAREWKYILLGAIVLVLVYFLYKKWTVIKNLGLGYSVATVPGLESVGASIAGVPVQQVRDEVQLLKNETHPGVQKDSKPPLKKEVEEPKRKKDEIIDSMIDHVQVKEENEVKNEVKNEVENESEDEDDFVVD